MRRFAAATCLLALTAVLAIAADQIESKKAPRDTSADTDPKSDFWRGAAPIVAEHDGSGNPVPGHRTEIRSRWTGGNLYFLFVCPYEQLSLKPEPKTEIETNELWKWDVAEVFIGSDFKNIRRYKEFEISPQGEWIDLDIDLDTPRHEDGWVWNSGSSLPPASTRPPRLGTASCESRLPPWIRALPQPAIPCELTFFALKDRGRITRQSSGNRLTAPPFTSRRFSEHSCLWTSPLLDYMVSSNALRSRSNRPRTAGSRLATMGWKNGGDFCLFGALPLICLMSRCSPPAGLRAPDAMSPCVCSNRDAH